MREYDAASASGIAESELLRANRELIGYFQAGDPGPLRIEVQNTAGRTISLFNARETAHLADVRELFRSVFTMQVISLAAVLTLAVLMLVWWPVRALAAAALYGSLLTIGLVSATALVALTGGFDAAWTQFHFLAFTNDLWRLNPATDHLIQMFPEPFWQDISVLIGAFTLLQALLIGGAAFIYLTASRPEAAPRPAPMPRPSLPRLPPPRAPLPGGGHGPHIPPQPRHSVH